MAAALEHSCRVVTSTYNEPLITAEWAHDVFVRARAAGLLTTFVSNGHATEEALDYLAPVLDACKVDLKAFSAKSYQALGGKLAAVLDTIRGLARARHLDRGCHPRRPGVQRLRRASSPTSPASWPASRPTSPGTSRRSTPTTG